MIKKLFLTCLLFLLCLFTVSGVDARIRINLMGYKPNAQKRAVLLSESPLKIDRFAIYDALTNKKMADFKSVAPYGQFDKFATVTILDFSKFNTEGSFYIKAGEFYSPRIHIGVDVYRGSADFLLNFLRLQRCGYNPVLKDVCHPYDGFITDGKHPETASDEGGMSALTDVSGGWHDGTHYMKNGAKTASMVFQLLFAYRMNPQAFGDKFDENGNGIPNNIPDVIDEAKWGLDWLLKMYPDKNTIYHQVGDNRGNESYELPEDDITDYSMGNGKERPVYIATGKPQGLAGFTNNSSGIASVAGKYASAFALGSLIMYNFYPVYADSLDVKAREIYETGRSSQGVTQSVPGNSDDYDKEENWADDMELAASQLYNLSFEPRYLHEAVLYGRMEPVIPWIFADSAMYNQWFPLTNYGHFVLANMEKPALKKEFLQNLITNLQRADLKRQENPFGVAVPMIRGSNNYAVAMATQCNLYRSYTGDTTFVNLENALVDWIFGCNPWGVSMVVDMPEHGYTPSNPASPLAQKYGVPLSGGLVNGPVQKEIYEYVKNQKAPKADSFKNFQTEWAVYNDDSSDKLTNEPTIDGTTSLMYLLSARQFEEKEVKQTDKNQYYQGGIIRANPNKKQIALIFSGHELSDGKQTILETLKRLDIKASFFLTGDFLRKGQNHKAIKQMVKGGHYVGPHSDKYMLYTQPKEADNLKVSKRTFEKDLERNYYELSRFGVPKASAPFLLPPQRAYNDSITKWSNDLGVTVIGNTPGLRSDYDITVPDMRRDYFSNIEIYNQILSVESKRGLNGYIMMFHMGADKKRTDKIYVELESLLSQLKYRGYEFVDLYEATGLHVKENGKNKKRKNP